MPIWGEIWRALPFHFPNFCVQWRFLNTKRRRQNGSRGLDGKEGAWQCLAFSLFCWIIAPYFGVCKEKKKIYIIIYNYNFHTTVNTLTLVKKTASIELSVSLWSVNEWVIAQYSLDKEICVFQLLLWLVYCHLKYFLCFIQCSLNPK